MKIVVVIAKYLENVSWIHEIRHSVIVFDKSPTPNENFIARPNIGREAETLLHYIITQYHDFPDAIIFLQGDPRGNPIRYTYEEVVQAINEETGTEVKPFVSTVFENPFATHWLKKGYVLHNILFEKTDILKYSSGAQYCITKEAVLNRPLKLYQVLHELIMKFGNKFLDGSVDTLDDGIDAWTLELMWHDIFNIAIPLKSTAIDELHKISMV